MPKKKPDRAPRPESLLVELLTEELPPKSLKRMSEAFANGVFEGLKEKYFLDAHNKIEPFASPRRLAVRISGVDAKQPDRTVERKGLSVQMGLDVYGQPTRALLGFARPCGVNVSKLERRKDEKSEYFVYQAKQGASAKTKRWIWWMKSPASSRGHTLVSVSSIPRSSICRASA